MVVAKITRTYIFSCRSLKTPGKKTKNNGISQSTRVQPRDLVIVNHSGKPFEIYWLDFRVVEEKTWVKGQPNNPVVAKNTDLSTTTYAHHKFKLVETPNDNVDANSDSGRKCDGTPCREVKLEIENTEETKHYFVLDKEFRLNRVVELPSRNSSHSAQTAHSMTSGSNDDKSRHTLDHGLSSSISTNDSNNNNNDSDLYRKIKVEFINQSSKRIQFYWYNINNNGDDEKWLLLNAEDPYVLSGKNTFCTTFHGHKLKIKEVPGRASNRCKGPDFACREATIVINAKQERQLVVVGEDFNPVYWEEEEMTITRGVDDENETDVLKQLEETAGEEWIQHLNDNLHEQLTDDDETEVFQTENKEFKGDNEIRRTKERLLNTVTSTNRKVNRARPLSTLPNSIRRL